MKIIIIDKAKGKGGYHARVFGVEPALQSFAKTELEALDNLREKILDRNAKKDRTKINLYTIHNN